MHCLVSLECPECDAELKLRLMWVSSKRAAPAPPASTGTPTESPLAPTPASSSSSGALASSAGATTLQPRPKKMPPPPALLMVPQIIPPPWPMTTTAPPPPPLTLPRAYRVAAPPSPPPPPAADLDSPKGVVAKPAQEKADDVDDLLEQTEPTSAAEAETVTAEILEEEAEEPWLGWTEAEEEAWHWDEEDTEHNWWSEAEHQEWQSNKRQRR